MRRVLARGSEGPSSSSRSSPVLTPVPRVGPFPVPPLPSQGWLWPRVKLGPFPTDPPGREFIASPGLTPLWTTLAFEITELPTGLLLFKPILGCSSYYYPMTTNPCNYSFSAAPAFSSPFSLSWIQSSCLRGPSPAFPPSPPREMAVSWHHVECPGWRRVVTIVS